MTYAAEIAKTCARPRTVVDLYDGVTHRYFSTSAFFVGAVFVEARLLSVSAVQFSAGAEGISQATLTLTLADPDQELYGLGIDLDWEITIYHTFPFELGSLTTGLTFSLVPDRVPSFDKGALSLRCVSPIAGNLGRLRLPMITAADVAGFSALTDVRDLIGQTFPAYFGRHADIQLDPVWFDGTYGYYVFAVSAADGANPYTSTRCEVHLKSGTEWVRVPRRQQRDTYLWDIFWELSTETLTRSGESTNWRLHWIRLTDELYDNTGYPVDGRIRLSFVTDPPSAARGDGLTPLTVTTTDVLKWLCDYYLSDASEGNVGTAGYDSTVFSAERDVAEDWGLAATAKLTQAGDGFALIQEIANKTVGFFVTPAGKLSIADWAETDSTAMQTGHATEPEILDWLDCLDSISRPDMESQNEVSVGSLQLVDTAAQAAAPLRRGIFSNPNLETSAAYLLAWRRLQKRRDLPACVRFGLPGPLCLSDFGPGDLALLTERHSGLSATPVFVEQFGIDFLAHRANLTVQSLSEWTGTDGHVLQDETSYEIALGGVTVSLIATMDVVGFSGDIPGVEVGDIFEIWTENNCFCATVTGPLVWMGAWVMPISVEAPATENGVSAYRITEPATSQAAGIPRAAFLCDTDDEFSDGEAGNRLLFR